MSEPVDDIKNITTVIATRIDWIQGAGGNTSVKNGTAKMLVKASGKTLEALIKEDTYVTVDIATIKNALANEDVLITEKAWQDYLQQAISEATVPPTPWKASMETAFHCLYDKYIIHTHNVYANVFLCSSGYDVLEQCFTGEEWYTVATANDYYTPGVVLSWHLYNQFRFEETMPNVTFLPNHGVIYSHNDKEKLQLLHQEVEQKLLSILQPPTYPTYVIQSLHDKYVVECDFLFTHFTANAAAVVFKELLFPDQAVYIHQQDFSTTNSAAKFFIDTHKKKLYASASMAETTAVIELLIAYYYIRKEIARKEWEPLTINYDWHNLTNMQSEQYRKSLL